MSSPNDKKKESNGNGLKASLDTTLRPKHWDEYVGQPNIKENLRILLTAAKERSHPPEHILF